MALTAAPSDAPWARLKLMVVEGNWPRWLTTSGAARVVTCTKAPNGTCPLVAVDDGRYSAFRFVSARWTEGVASKIIRYWLDCV